MTYLSALPYGQNGPTLRYNNKNGLNVKQETKRMYEFSNTTKKLINRNSKEGSVELTEFYIQLK